jgi:hypothetical protein
MTFLPECLDDWVGNDNPVHVIEAFVEALDLPGLGYAGAAVRLFQMVGGELQSPSVVLPVELVLRNSTGRAKQERNR